MHSYRENYANTLKDRWKFSKYISELRERKTALAEIFPRYHDNEKIFASFAPTGLFAECQDNNTLIFSSIF